MFTGGFELLKPIALVLLAGVASELMAASDIAKNHEKNLYFGGMDGQLQAVGLAPNQMGKGRNV
jgi:hypothetical protein